MNMKATIIRMTLLGIVLSATDFVLTQDVVPVPETGTDTPMNGGGNVGINPYNGMQECEQIFEFTEKPEVVKNGDKWTIRFTSKARCDATVAIVDKDGKIVRHLASGVLGKNAPWPFQQNSLSQKIEWDGKDDKGQPAPAGCSVRVGLGLKATFGKVLAWHPKFRQLNRPTLSLAADKDGVYMLDSFFWQQLRRFDHAGNYVRTLVPPPAGLPHENRTGMPYVKDADGQEIPVVENGGLIHLGLEKSQGGMTVIGGRIFIQGGGGRETGLHLYCVGTDGSIKGRSRDFAKRQVKGIEGLIGLTGSPDGKNIYVSLPSLHAIWRFANDETFFTGSGELLQSAPFFGERSVEGNDDKHLKSPLGLACDKDGNLYVCDSGNNRIIVVKPDGSVARSLKMDIPPHRAEVHPGTGEIYLASLLPKKGKDWNSVVVKLSADGSEVSRFSAPAIELHSGWKGPLATFCVDFWSDPVTIWLQEGHGGVARVADRGKSFEVIESFSETVKKDMGNMPSWGLYKWELITVDREREILYHMLPGTRIDPATGAIAPFKFRTSVEQMTSDIDGLVYLKSHSGSGCSGQNIYRMDHDGKLAPFPDGHNGQQTVGKWGNKVPQDLVDAALFDVAHWTGRGFQMGIGVAPNGDVYSANYGDRGNTSVGPLKGPTGGGPVIYAYSSDGKMKGKDLVQDTPNGTYGVRVDRQGNIYLGLGARTEGSGVPRGLDASASKVKAFSGYRDNYVGTVVKVKPGSKCVYGDGPFSASKKKLKIEGLIWSYYGQSTLTANLNCCVCPNSQFDLDYFARVFVPQAHCSSVTVLDTNGNEILRIGRYGNADSQGPQSLVPEPEIAYLFPIYVTVSDKALYVADLGNARIVRADLGYHTIETAPLR